MLRRKLSPVKAAQQGFTLVELLVTISLVAILSTFTYSAFNSSLIQYFDLQEEGMNFSSLASQSHRLANVIRGTTGIISANQDELNIYSYYSPADTYVSQTRYYKNAANTKLYAEVTRMTANPPIGSPIPSTTKTYEVLDNYYQAPGVKLFTYLDASGAELATPITDLNTIKGVRIRLAVPGGDKNTNQAIDLQVSLRNRKTNL